MKINQIINDIKNFDFSSIEMEEPGEWPTTFKIIACIFCFTIPLFLGNFFYLSSTNDQQNNAIRHEKQLKNEYKIKYFQSANLDELKKQIDDINIKINDIAIHLPTDSEVPGILEDISRAGKDSGLHIVSIKLQEEKNEDYYIVLPITVSVKGNYHKFGDFVSKISNLSRIVNLEDFEISQGDYSGILKMNIVAKTYRHKKQE